MQTWAITDPGNIREQNQDAYAVINFGHERMLLVVCDGMGGAKSGNVASSLAVEVFTEEVRRVQKTGMRREAIDAMLTGALQLANQAVFDQAHLSEEFRGMGTTLVAAYAVKDNITNHQRRRQPRVPFFKPRRRSHHAGSFHRGVYGGARRADAGTGEKPPRQERHHPRRRHGGGGRGRPLSPDGAQGRLPAALLRRPLQTRWPIRRCCLRWRTGCGGATAAAGC